MNKPRPVLSLQLPSDQPAEEVPDSSPITRSLARLIQGGSYLQNEDAMLSPRVLDRILKDLAA